MYRITRCGESQIWPFAYHEDIWDPYFGEGEVVGGQRWYYNFRTTPSMPRLGETPYFPMQAGPKGLRGV